MWVPGHAGIPENEEADQAAKAAGAGTGVAEERRLPHCAQSVRTRVEAYFDNEMQEQWRGLMTRRNGIPVDILQIREVDTATDARASVSGLPIPRQLFPQQRISLQLRPDRFPRMPIPWK